MKRFQVHIFVEVRIPVTVEAESHGEAVQKGLAEVQLERDFRSRKAEWAEDISHYLVDELDEKGDIIEDGSKWYRDIYHEANEEEFKKFTSILPDEDFRKVEAWWNEDSSPSSRLDDRFNKLEELGLLTGYAEFWFSDIPPNDQAKLILKLRNQLPQIPTNENDQEQSKI